MDASKGLRGANIKPCFVCPQTYRATGVVLTAESCDKLEMYRKPNGYIDHVEGWRNRGWVGTLQLSGDYNVSISKTGFISLAERSRHIPQYA